MVQRKVPNKLVIQADHVKSSTLLANLNNKPSSPRGGSDLTKKMKKSRLIKRSSSDCIGSSRSSTPPLRKEVAQPGKPPPQKLKQSPAKVYSGLTSSTADASQRKSPARMLLEASPNYMKSTSSYDARKERSASAPRISQTPLVNKTPSPKKPEKPKLGSSVSGHKASRTSNLEMVRTLTKTPSFKPSRASKKCSPVALCEEFDVQKPTCSSTLKDSKFPDHLELNHGGTELEGTSAFKVCPYTYCSLNGHHHAPLPPLKSFLSARRHMMKTQRSFKLGCLSPRRKSASGDIKKEADVTLVIAPKETEIQQADLEALEVGPTPQEHKDFFIEVYSKDGDDGEIVESPDIDVDNLDGNSDAMSIELDVGEFSPDYWMEGVAEETYPPLPAQEETTAVPCNLPDQPYSEASDMEWELKSVEIYANIKKVYDEESIGSEAWLKDGDSDADAPNPHSGSDQVLDLSNNQSSDGDSTIKETDGNNESSRGESIEDTIEGPTTVSEDRHIVLDANNQFPVVVQLGDDKIQCTSNHLEDEFTQETSTGEARDEMETDQIDATKSVVKIIEPSDSLEGFTEADQERATEDAYGSKINQTFTDEGPSSNMQDDSPEKQSDTKGEVETPNNLDNDHEEAKKFKPSNSHISEDHTESEAVRLQKNENREQAIEDMEEECANNCSGENTCSAAKNKSSTAPKNVLPHVSSISDEELLKTCTNMRIIRNKQPDEELEGLRDFNPRDPNFLPVEPDLEGEKVDLRHQMMDERKNAEEWMVDFALRQAVSRLATARKRKVSLLVEAFEKVTPIPKYQTYLRQNSPTLEHTRTIQACS